ncbi:MAG: serine--tRNA ligase [Candidatus Nealsonbacteria bacterium]|nr:serine--tRNA ligase [Candidatus Nealsonbacteria bacterium]
MLDIKTIRENPQKIKEACSKKQAEVDIDRILELDKERRELLLVVEEMRAKKNRASEKIAKTKDKKTKESVIAEMRELDEESDKKEELLRELEKELRELMLQVPNPPHDDVPVGKDEEDNIVLRKVGAKPDFDFEFRDYLKISEELNLIDVERAAKVSGSRFGYLKNEAVILEFALVTFVFEKLVKKDFVPVLPPVMIRPEMMRAMGYVERGAEEIYFIEKDNLYLIGTSEQSIGPMHAGEIFNQKELPKRYVGFSSCFRREAGSYGKDTRGILRVHQFDKAEMFVFAEPGESRKEHQLLLSIEEEIMKELGLPYQVINICTGDLGDPAAAKYDIEAWIPSEDKYRETHSTSDCTDFQARRLNIRYRGEKGELDYVHTLNGTGLAIGRTLIAIIENYQQKDGGVIIPEVLRPYTKFEKIDK